MNGTDVSRREVMGAVGLAAAGSALLHNTPAVAATGTAAGKTMGKISTPADEVVETRSGKVRGFLRDNIRIFRGIPYGRTTEGAGRFLPPQPPAAWTGIRSCLSYGPVSPHPPRGDWGQDETQFLYDWDDGFPGEDCLRLNVWSAIEGQKKPVMVWIHGGGFTSGSCQELPSYDGTRLARRGVVLVSVNHRLGPLGFLDYSQLGGAAYDGSGNAGMVDLVAALQWVRDNIAGFGGDPDRVTIFGQSGGGGKVSALMAMPSAKGLFHRAIVQSGSFPMQLDQEGARRLAAGTVAELGLTPSDLKKLQQIPADALISAGNRAIAKLNAAGGTINFEPGVPIRLPRVGWGPSVDGHLIPEAMWTDHAPAVSASVPLIVGTVREEFKLPSLSSDEADLKARVNRLFGARGEQVLSALKNDFPRASPTELLGIMGGMSWRADALAQATKKHAQGGAPVYNYWFTWQPPVLQGRAGAFHCLDLAFCFDNTARCDQSTGDTEEARHLADVMARSWIAFAATGNPGLKDLDWPAFEPTRRMTMVFDAKSEARADPAGTSLRAFSG